MRTLAFGLRYRALAAAPAVAQQKTVKIGFVSTFSGPVAAIGNDMRNSFELALDHHGRKLGGLPVEVIYEDDQVKPEVGVQKIQKLIESDKVDFLVGIIWSNVLLASLKPIIDSKTFTIITNAGASQLAGEMCSPYVFSTSWNNDQTPQAIGLYMNQKNVKRAFLIGPNYAAGKDMLEGVEATFKGKIIGRELTTGRPARLPGRASKARDAKPDAIFAFYPGWRWHPVHHPIRAVRPQGPDPALHRVHHRLAVAAAAQGSGLGIPGAQQWVRDLPNDGNKEYVDDFRAKYKATRRSTARRPMTPSPLLDSVVRRSRATSPRRRDAPRGGEGRLQVGARQLQVRAEPHPDPELLSPGSGQERRVFRMKTVATIVENDQDKHFQKCKMPN